MNTETNTAAPGMGDAMESLLARIATLSKGLAAEIRQTHLAALAAQPAPVERAALKEIVELESNPRTPVHTITRMRGIARAALSKQPTPAEPDEQYASAEALIEHLDGLADDGGQGCEKWEPAQAAIDGIRAWQAGSHSGGALLDAARSFYNMTVADTEVRITTADESKRDRIAAAADQLRANLSPAQPAPGVGLTAIESEALEGLIMVAYHAWSLADNAEQTDAGHNVDATDFQQLSEALDRLDALPDDQPGYTMSEAAKARWALRRLTAIRPAESVAQGGIECYVGDMTTSAGMEYYVCFRRNGKIITPHRFRVRGKAEYGVAEYNHFFNDGPEPDILAYDTDEPIDSTPTPATGSGGEAYISRDDTIFVGQNCHFGDEWFCELTLDGVKFLAPIDERQHAMHLLATKNPIQPKALPPKGSGGYDREMIADYLEDYADGLFEDHEITVESAREQARLLRSAVSTDAQQYTVEVAPVCWSLPGFIHDDDGRPIGTDEPRVVWGAECPDETEGWSPLYAGPTPATGSGGEDRDLMLTVAEEWLAMHKEHVRASDFERWQYVPLVEDLIGRLAHPAPAGGDAGDGK